jgi:hypothetical protein
VRPYYNNLKGVKGYVASGWRLTIREPAGGIVVIRLGPVDVPEGLGHPGIDVVMLVHRQPTLPSRE